MTDGVLSSPWLRLYKVVGEIPGQSDLISGVITAPAPASRLTHRSQPGPCQVSDNSLPHRLGSVWSPLLASGTRARPGLTQQAGCESKNSGDVEIEIEMYFSSNISRNLYKPSA